MTLRSGKLFGGQLMAGRLFGGIVVAIIITGTCHSKNVVYIPRRIADVWVEEYRSLAVTSDFRQQQIVRAIADCFVPSERNILVGCVGRTVIVAEVFRSLHIEKESVGSGFNVNYPNIESAKETLYILFNGRTILVGNYSRAIAVEGYARSINIPSEEFA